MNIEKEISPKEIKNSKIYQKIGLTDGEYQLIVEKFLHRLPNYTEIGLYSGMWSEHCSYKNSKSVLKRLPNSNKQVIKGPGEGAGIIDIGDHQGVVFKAESHNHPSAVEPFQGATTGVGGILRDIFSMGARPIACLDSLRFMEPKNDNDKYLISQIVAGISSYGNCIGVPTVGGDTTFDDNYKNNPLVNVMCVGLMNLKDIEIGAAKGTGNSILYVGAKTGRDGINGASFASSQFDSKHKSQRSAIQVGDPFTEKLVMEACLDAIKNHHKSVIGIQDMGAAGLVSSSAEMGSKAGGNGINLNLDLVPKREKNMSAFDIMLSESQERMLLCIKAGTEKEIINTFSKHGVEAVIIGHVTNNHQYKLFYHQNLVASVPINSLDSQAPVYHRKSVKPKHLVKLKGQQYNPKILSPNKTLEGMLKQLTIASKENIYQTYDSQVQTNTLVGPGSDAAIIRIRHYNKALSITTDVNGRYLYLNPEIGGQIAVAEAARNIVASGATPLGITDCLNFGNPTKPEQFYELDKATIGISKAAKVFHTPIISGNVSLNNEYNNIPIYPTPMIGMVGLVKNLKHIITQNFQSEGDLVYVIGQTQNAFNGSEIQKMQLGKINGKLFSFNLAYEYKIQQIVHSLNKKDLLHSVHDISEGGLIIAIAESCFGKHLGVNLKSNLKTKEFFSESQSRFLVSIPKRNEPQFKQITGKNAHYLGHVTNDNHINVKTSENYFDINTSKAFHIWKGAMPCSLK